MSIIRRDFLFFIIPLIILTLLSFLIDFFSKLNTTGEQGKINKLFHHQLDEEVVIFGSSVSAIHFNPRIIDSITGMNSFNMGLTGCTYDQADVLINEYANYTRKCKWLVLGLTYNDFEPRLKISNGGYYYPYIDNPSVYESLVQINPELIHKIKYIPFYKFSTYNKEVYSGCTNGIKNWLGVTLVDSEYKGFHADHSRIWPADLKYDYKEKAVMNDKVVTKFTARIQEWIKHDFKILLVIPPFHEEGYKAIDGFEKVKQMIQEIALKYPNKVYYEDYTMNPICKEKNLFFNASHLRDVGADRFSIMFSKKIVELSHHNL